MPRIKRIYLEEGIFHILARGNNKQWLFKDKSDFKYYLDILKRLKKEQPFLLYHYILMNNHVHLLIETNRKTELSKLMKRINLLYYNHYKRKYNYAGHFWQDRFKSILVSRDEYLLSCGLYIEGNPIRAGLVKKAEDYPYSSFKYYAYGDSDGLIGRDPFYDNLGKDNAERQKEYQKLILQGDNRINKQALNNFFLEIKNLLPKWKGSLKYVISEIGEEDRKMRRKILNRTVPILTTLLSNTALKWLKKTNMDYGLLAESFDKDSGEAKTGVGFASGCGYLAYSLYYVLIKEERE